MKTTLFASAMFLLVSGMSFANAQGSGPYHSETIHQSAGDRDSRGTPKYYAPETRHSRTSRPVLPRSTTTGAGSGPYYSRSIHQSAGERDSRGTPKYYQH